MDQTLLAMDLARELGSVQTEPIMISALFLLAWVQNPEPAPAPPKDAWELLTREHDKNEDGKITRKEYSRDDVHWRRLDKNSDGVLLRDEIMGSSGGRGRGGARGDRGGRGFGGGQRGERGGAGRGVAPKLGQVAPDFDLEILPPPTKKAPLPSGKKKSKVGKTKAAKPKTVKLSSFKNKRPVALIFGSYT